MDYLDVKNLGFGSVKFLPEWSLNVRFPFDEGLPIQVFHSSVLFWKDCMNILLLRNDAKHGNFCMEEHKENVVHQQYE